MEAGLLPSLDLRILSFFSNHLHLNRFFFFFSPPPPPTSQPSAQVIDGGDSSVSLSYSFTRFICTRTSLPGCRGFNWSSRLFGRFLNSPAPKVASREWQYGRPATTTSGVKLVFFAVRRRVLFTRHSDCTDSRSVLIDYSVSLSSICQCLLPGHVSSVGQTWAYSCVAKRWRTTPAETGRACAPLPAWPLARAATVVSAVP